MRTIRAVRKGFSLIELLVVIAIVAVLAALLAPVMIKAKEQAKVARVHVELRGVEAAIQMYCDDWSGKPPLASSSCEKVNIADYYELPPPLYKYIATMRFYDPFNPGRTYKYIAPGLGYVNNSISLITLYIPSDYPQSNQPCIPYHNPATSPVKWVVWSVGPSEGCSLFTFDQNLMPVPKQCWYPSDQNGIIVRLSDGRTSP